MELKPANSFEMSLQINTERGTYTLHLAGYLIHAPFVSLSGHTWQSGQALTKHVLKPKSSKIDIHELISISFDP